MASNRCAACRVLRRTCTEECVFAPYFPSSQPMKFESVHKIFGAENVSNIISNLPPQQRAIAVDSLCYVAEARKRDPISGVPGMILYHKNILNNLVGNINFAANELANNMGPDKIPPFYDIPMPDDFLTIHSSLREIMDRVAPQGDASTSAAQGTTNAMLWNREDHETRDGNGATRDGNGVGASTSAGPSNAS